MKIGVVLPIAEGDEGVTPRYPEIRALALQAEAAEFDSVWIYDHLLYRRPDHPTAGIWESSGLCQSRKPRVSGGEVCG